MKLVLDSLILLSNNFFSSQIKILIDEKQIKFDWNHFDKDYFHKILDMSHKDFKYQLRLTRNLFSKRKPAAFDWSKKIDWKIFN